MQLDVENSKIRLYFFAFYLCINSTRNSCCKYCCEWWVKALTTVYMRCKNLAMLGLWVMLTAVCVICPRCLPFANFPGRLLGVALPFFRHPFIVFFYHWKHHTYILVAFNARPRVQHTFSHDSRLESTHNALFNSWFFLSFDNEHNGFGSTPFKRKKSALDIRLAWLFGSRSLLELSQLILGLRIEIKWMHGLHEQASEEKSPSKISYH